MTEGMELDVGGGQRSSRSELNRIEHLLHLLHTAIKCYSFIFYYTHTHAFVQLYYTVFTLQIPAIFLTLTSFPPKISCSHRNSGR